MTLRPWPAAEALGPPIEYPRGALLCRQGNDVQSLLLIGSGVVKIFHEHVDGESLVTGWRLRGWLLGVASVVTGVVHSASAEVLTPTVVRSLTVVEFQRLRRDNQHVNTWIADSLAREVYEQAVATALLVGNSAERRVEAALAKLLHIGRVTVSGDHVRLAPLVTLSDVAELVSVAPSQFSRICTKLEQAGEIRRCAHGVLEFPKGGRVYGLARLDENQDRC